MLLIQRLLEVESTPLTARSMPPDQTLDYTMLAD